LTFNGLICSVDEYAVDEFVCNLKEIVIAMMGIIIAKIAKNVGAKLVGVSAGEGWRGLGSGVLEIF
jgi:hypothetical protein